ncbi:Gfo/Idh/MocA family protein [Negadavirga shengliensis]|uniref:Gfo/Idh/MocA family protein n=1 Tax=Negadavirga shengliensis TaxID=1389218 RepID=A0ABV9SX55_9BACT
MDSKTDRRKFLHHSLLMTAGIGLVPGAFATTKKVSANDRINVGLIGCRNMGFHGLRTALNTGEVNCLGICDVDQKVLAQRQSEIKEEFGQNPKTYGDFRKLLEDKEIDAVFVGTPDHWHCLPTIYACEAGKDVYVEKPLANTIHECNLMVAAARKHNRIVQVGQQQRSGKVWKAVMAYIHAGKLGKLRKVNIWANFRYGTGAEKQPDGPVPDGVDFDMWLGPAPKRSFNPTRFHGNWRHFWDYGGGLMTDWGVHLIDMGLWAGDVKEGPKEIMAFGDNLSYPDHSRETFDTMSVTYPMGDFVMNWEHTAGIQVGPYDMPYGVEFVGDNAVIVADRGDWSVKPEKAEDGAQVTLEAKQDFMEDGPGDLEAHVRNFIEAVRSRKQPNCPVETGRNVALYAHMGNIAVRSGAGRLLWDEGNLRFTNHEEANRFILPEYRDPWRLPVY